MSLSGHAMSSFCPAVKRGGMTATRAPITERCNKREARNPLAAGS
jgi:hypothetical protein